MIVPDGKHQWGGRHGVCDHGPQPEGALAPDEALRSFSPAEAFEAAPSAGVDTWANGVLHRRLRTG